MSFLEIILTPFSWLLTFAHTIFGSYGIALFLFAVVVRAIMFPFNLRGKRSQIGMSMIQDKVQKIQKQYANNRTKANEEIQALYDKEGVKPTSGCLWSLIPLLILFPLYAVIRQPITYMMHVSSEALVRVAETLQQVGADVVGTLGISNITDLTTSVVSSGYNEMKLASLFNGDFLTAAQGAANHVSAGAGDGIFTLNFNFIGLDLSQIPQWQFWNGSFTWGYIGLFLLPLVSAALGLAMSFFSQRTNRMANPAASRQMSGSMRVMMFISPLISLWIGFSYPAALCIYWISNNLLSIVSEWLSARILRKDYAEATRKREEQERLEKEAEKKRKQEAAERKYHAMEQAKQNRAGSSSRKKKKKPQPKPAETGNEASREGMRRYARGRSYDPDRYGGVTPYQDPNDAPIDENAVFKARAEREAQEKEKRTQEAMQKFDQGLDLDPDEQQLVDEELVRQAEEELKKQDGEMEPPEDDEEEKEVIALQAGEEEKPPGDDSNAGDG